MEQQEDKTKNVKRKRRRTQSPPSSNSASSLPLDLASIILSKLPTKSVLRFRCVSKLWSSISTDPCFIKSFKTRPRLLMFYKQNGKLFVFSLPQHNQNPKVAYSSSQPIDSHHLPYPKNGFFPDKTESVHSLICLEKSTKPIIWNPSMRQFLTLRAPEGKGINKAATMFLGYDPIEGKHKVMCMPSNEEFDECWVLTLRSVQERWRTIKTNHTHCHFVGGTGVYGRCIKGVLYYLAGLGTDRFIMSFDVRSETFNVITFPWDKCWQMMMISYEGKLACVDNSNRGESISMWVLEDATKHEWSYHLFSTLSHYGQDLQYLFKLVGATDDGELIYAPETLFKSLDIIYIDPKRNTFRKVEHTGIADDDFRERNGLGETRLCNLGFCPNHIETLLAL